MSLQPKAVSSPGKVLLAGGYLVLDRKHTGLVFGLDARIHVHVKLIPTSEGISLQEIIVKSPQFTGATWRYGYSASRHGGGVGVTQLRTSVANLPPNVFVEIALSYALTYVTSLLEPFIIEPAMITILADNDYYSHNGRAFDTANGATKSQFKIFDLPIWDAHKTGLGSSAALVTSFIGAVLTHYLPLEVFDISSEIGKRKLHNLAQAAHSAAQGKVGSGFDVGAAVYGSCVYRRFSASLLESIGEPGSGDFADRLKATVDESDKRHKWDTEITTSTVTVPRGIRIVMCDVDCGSKTPGMVKKVLDWRKQCPQDADRIWSGLQAKNDALAAEMVRMARDEDTKQDSLKQIVADIRSLVREMSKCSGVPIEPKAQTRLLDACSDIPGVISGVAPGAGGYDAVALIVEDKPDVIEDLDRLLKSWKFEGDGSDGHGSGRVRRLGVREEHDSCREEKAAEYDAWLN